MGSIPATKPMMRFATVSVMQPTAICATSARYTAGLCCVSSSAIATVPRAASSDSGPGRRIA